MALDVMQAISSDARTLHLLNVRNRGAIRGMDADAVVEVPCMVDGNGAHPFVVGDVPAHALGLMTTVKAVERDTIEASLAGDRDRAWRALALHPLVASVSAARQILDGYWPISPSDPSMGVHASGVPL